MGGFCGIVIGSDLEAQLKPFHASSETNQTDFYHFSWYVGPLSTGDDSDWIFAFKLKPGQLGEPGISQYERPGLSFSARKGAIDFDGTRAQVALWAGRVWDYGRRVGLPEAYAQASPCCTNPQKAPPRDAAFDEGLEDYLYDLYPDETELRFAWWFSIDYERLCYEREAYIEALYVLKLVDFSWPVIIDGVLHEGAPELVGVADHLLRDEIWSRHVLDIILQLPDETLVSKVTFKA